MHKIYILLFSVLILTSCGHHREGEQKNGLLSNLIDITDNESKGVDEILGFYGGRCEYSVGFSASTKEGKKKYFALEMSQSAAIEKLEDNLDMPSSNIAYLFYRNLREESKNYDEIHAVIILKDGTKKTFVYSRELLESVHKRMKLVHKVVALLKQKEYEQIKSLLDNEVLYQYDKEAFIEKLKKVDPQLGNIVKFNPYGFKIRNTKSGRKMLHVSGALIRDIQNTGFSIDIELNSDKDEVFLLQYKL